MKAGIETAMYNQGYMDGFDDAVKSEIEKVKPKLKDVKENSFPKDTSDYWARLEHTYAGMAMNALLLTNNIRNGDLEGMRECNTNALAIAYALVQKLKEKEERK